jgi:predicted esterase
MMKFNNFAELDRYGDILTAEGKNEEALDLFLRASEVLPREEYEREYFLITSYTGLLYLKSGREEDFYNVVKNLIDNGYACGNWIVREFSKKVDERYVELFEKNKLLLTEAQRNAEMKYSVCLPKGYTYDKKYPVFFALHGDGGGENIHSLSVYWKTEAFVKSNFILVYVQSSQVYCHNGYQWNNDINIARKDIRNCVSEVLEKYSIDKNCIIVGGFSGGAMASVDFSMNNVIPLKGFVSIYPRTVSKYFSAEKAEAASNRGIRGVIIEGELELEPSVQDMLKVFDEKGIKYKYEIIKGVGHVYPEDFTEKLENAIKFILDK